jgi:hypothetical protein
MGKLSSEVLDTMIVIAENNSIFLLEKKSGNPTVREIKKAHTDINCKKVVFSSLGYTPGVS